MTTWDTLASLLSPASRIEPELLRAVRLACLPELGVEAEHELWFSNLVDARSDSGITFAPMVASELRVYLSELYRGPNRPVVERARGVMREVHAPISPLLLLEEELAWSEVVDDATRTAEIADLVVRAVAAGRSGIEHWLARVWPTVPKTVWDTPSGWVLGQVASTTAGRPRGHGTAPAELVGYQVAALLSSVPSTRLYLARRHGVLRLGVAAEDAEASIDLPDTEPRLVEVTGHRIQSLRLLVPSGSAVDVEVGDAPVRLRTVAGDVYVFGDPERELLDTVRLGPGGSWCITGIGADALVLGTGSDLASALTALPTLAGSIDILDLVDIDVQPPVGAGGLFAFPLPPQSSGADPAVRWLINLSQRPIAPFEDGSVVRTIGVNRAGELDVVTVRGGARTSSSLVVELETGPAKLVPGAPLVDEADRVVGIVAPPSWGGRAGHGAMAVTSDALEVVANSLALPRDRIREMVVVVTDEDHSATAPKRLRIGKLAAEALAGGVALWVLRHRSGDAYASLGYRYGSYSVRRTATFGWEARPRRSEDVDVFPANNATHLMEMLHTRGPDRESVYALDDAELRVFEAFAEQLRVLNPRSAPAARVGDPTGHPGVIGPPGVPTVLIGGMPAAVVGTPHICSFPPPAVHPPSVIAPPGSPTVLIGGLPAARVGDIAACGAPVVTGCPTVIIGG